jgi:monoamine oxidase
MGVPAELVEHLRSSKGAAQVMHWPREPHLSDEPAPADIHPHPQPVRQLAAPQWGGKLLFAGTETDQASPGVIEGAIGSARAALAHLSR